MVIPSEFLLPTLKSETPHADSKAVKTDGLIKQSV
jgi:hypothetical protein